MASNLDHFNAVTGLIFTQLYEAFPLTVRIDYVGILQALGLEPDLRHGTDGRQFVSQYPDFENGTNSSAVLNGAVSWLEDEGFIRKNSYDEHTLTSRALAALNSVPESVGGATLGSKLGGAAKHAGAEAGRAAIGEVVGQVIGAAARGFFGPS